MKDDIQSLAHSKWWCKYHIVFSPKYRRQIIYGKIKADVGKILRELSERKGVEIIEAECSRPYPHAGDDPTAYERVAIYGVFKEQE